MTDSAETNAPVANINDQESVRPVSWGRAMGAALVAGLATGLVAWLASESIHDLFRPVLVKPKSDFSNENDLLKLAAIAREARFAFLILGGVMGLFFGLAGGLARGSARTALGAGVVGLLLGLAASLGASAVFMPISSANGARMLDDLAFSIMVIGGLWGPLGLTAGLAFGLGLGNGNRGAVLQGATGGLVGALLGTVVFLLVGAIQFPLAETGTPYPLSSSVRALARFSVAVPAGLFAASSALRALSPKKRKKGAVVEG